MSEEKVLNGEHCEDLKEKELPNELPYEAIETDPALDRRITRKFDTHVVPWLFGLWLLAFIDRSNIGNARIDGLNTDLKLDGDKFNIALTVFYVPYILIGVPSNWALKHVGAGYYLPGLLIGWGTVSVCLGAVKTYGGLITARFFLGLCEGGLLGGMVLYLSMFYRRHDLLFRLGLFYCAAPLSGAFGGLLATGLAEIHFHGYNRWPWIFFVEGAISVLFGILTIYFLPHTPMQAKCLTEEERVVAVARMKLDAHGASNKSNVESEHFAWPWVRMAVLNWNTVLLSLNFFAIITPIYSFSLFLPTIISSLGYSSVKAQLFTVPPNMGGFFMVIIGTYLSDKIKMRGPIMIVGCLLAIIGYIMLLVPAHPLVHYGGTFFIAAGVFPSSPAVMAWLANNLAPHYLRATGTGLQIAIANCAAFIATFTYLQKDAPRYVAGHSINLGFLVLSIILSTTTMLYAKWENGKRARGDRNHRLAEGDQGMLGYRHPIFRYTK
ncbi:hypothetical protein ABVK25_006353 [Lepraria finkii]|uniref:Major facilitator superfamily (MFS) profile domain-containing protein n=1 Tax=Lepraria finkii TaxID=1340010 RepID=A0ABR4B920_9LECA